MKISRQQLQQAVIDGILSTDQADSLYRYLKHQPGTGPDFNFTHIFYYLGGLTAIGAMTLFMNLGWEEFGGWGVLAFWCGLTLQHSDSELAKFLYLLTDLGLIGIGAVLVRRVFVVFGALGCTAYLEHLASSIFQDSWLFPITLTAIGLGIIYLGILWQRHEAAITVRVQALLPQALQELLAARGQA